MRPVLTEQERSRLRAAAHGVSGPPIDVLLTLYCERCGTEFRDDTPRLICTPCRKGDAE